MIRNVPSLADKKYDLVIIGGGFFGICAAWDAAQRGLSVALIDKGDFCSATSSNHFRMIHGGIRYLQHADLYRVRESSHERSALLRVAPHLVHPLPIVIPTYGHGMKGKEILAAGLWLYNVLTVDRNRGIPDPKRHIPSGRILSRKETLEMFPDLQREGLTGAVIFYDGQTFHPGRLGLAFLKSAVEAGADVANYVEAMDFIRDGRQILGVRACDVLSGDEIEIHGRVVLNTAGPWALWLLKEKLDVHLRPEPTFSRDACFIVKKQITGPYALTVLGRAKDPDALLSRGHRHLFIVPWQDHSLVGVWHVVYKGRPEDFTVTQGDLQGFLDEINEAYASLKLKVSDVSNWMAGLVLFGENQEGEDDLSYGKRSQIIDHALEDQLENLITLIGVRFTTARGMAEQAIDLVYRKLNRKSPKCSTAFIQVHGGQIKNFDEFQKQALRARPLEVPAETMLDLAHNHGACYPEVLVYLREDPSLAETIGSSRVIKAEVIHAVREEMAQKLGDVVFRRTNLGQCGDPGEEALQTCAELMAFELGWDRERLEREVAQVKGSYPAFLNIQDREKQAGFVI